MSEQQSENPKNDDDQLNDTNDGNEIITLEEILNQQREIDEVNYFVNVFNDESKIIRNIVNMWLRMLPPCWVVPTRMFVPILR